MSRTYPPRRVKVDMRIDAPDLADVDALATAEERTRSEMLRIVLRLGVAARNARAGRPRKDTG